MNKTNMQKEVKLDYKDDLRDCVNLYIELIKKTLTSSETNMSLHFICSSCELRELFIE
jgi:hypothetical protein